MRPSSPGTAGARCTRRPPAHPDVVLLGLGLLEPDGTEYWPDCGLPQPGWGPAPARETNYLCVSLARLRRKLESDPSTPRYLHAKPGLGSRFTP